MGTVAGRPSFTAGFRTWSGCSTEVGMLSNAGNHDEPVLPQIWGFVSVTLTCNPSDLEVEVVFELPLPCSRLSDSGNWDWYYEQPLPEGRKNYTKTAPIQFEESAVPIKWWGKRKETDNAWKVTAAERLANGCNLDRKNPCQGRHHAPAARTARRRHPEKGTAHRGNHGQHPKPPRKIDFDDATHLQTNELGVVRSGSGERFFWHAGQTRREGCQHFGFGRTSAVWLRCQHSQRAGWPKVRPNYRPARRTDRLGNRSILRMHRA